jgi:hypothetical protein
MHPACEAVPNSKVNIAGSALFIGFKKQKDYIKVTIEWWLKCRALYLSWLVRFCAWNFTSAEFCAVAAIRAGGH